MRSVVKTAVDMQIKDRRAYSTGGRVRGGNIGVGVAVIATPSDFGGRAYYFEKNIFING